LIQIGVTSVAAQLRSTRHQLRERLESQRVEAGHVSAIETVANELLGAAFERGVSEPVGLTVMVFTLLTSVRVTCPRNVDLRDEPFGVRERVLEGLAFAWGKRTYGDGSVDLWAEVARVSD
jgi:hypothetical protein